MVISEMHTLAFPLFLCFCWPRRGQYCATCKDRFWLQSSFVQAFYMTIPRALFTGDDVKLMGKRLVQDAGD